MRRYLTTRRGQGREDSGELPSLVRNVPLFASSQNVVGKTIECQLGGEWTNGWKVRLADTFQPPYHSQRRANEFGPVIVAKLFIGTEAQYITKMLRIG